MKKIFLTSAAALALMTAPAFAAADVKTLATQVEALQQQLLLLQKQLEELKANDAAAKDALAKEVAAREASEKAGREAALAAGGRVVFTEGRQQVIPAANPKVTESGTHRFALSSPDGAWTIAPTGRLHFDFGGYISQKAEGVTGPGTTAGGKLSSGVNARRARLGVTGRAMNDFTYSLILDAGGATDGPSAINEARLGYTGIRNTIIEIGYGSQHFAMEEAMSSNDIVFLERSTPTTLASSFNAGDPRFTAGFRTWEPNWWFGAYLTSSAPNVTHALTKRGFGAFQRASYNPIQNELQSVHIGIASAQVFDVPNSGPNTPASFTMSDRPELRIDPTPLLNTGALGTLANPVTSVQVYNAESAVALGGFFYQGEYFKYVVNRRGKPAADFFGAYAMVSYTIGGRRTYLPASGAYSGVNPVTPFSPAQGGWGAFEFAARFSYTDLIDHYNSSVLAANQPFMVNGGRQSNITVGINWFWNSNMLWKLNYIHSNFDKANPITTAAGLPVPLGLRIDAIAARFQIMF